MRGSDEGWGVPVLRVGDQLSHKGGRWRLAAFLSLALLVCVKPWSTCTGWSAESDQTIDCIIYGRPWRQSELSAKTYRTGGEAKVDVFDYIEPLQCQMASLDIGLCQSRGSKRALINSPAYGSGNSLRYSHQTASFAAFTGRALMIFRAGLALNTVGCLVNGLMPARSLVAGFLMTTNFAKPGSRKAPVFLSSL